jgi:hypothetical protein
MSPVAICHPTPLQLTMSSASEMKGIMEQLRVLQTLDERSITLSVPPTSLTGGLA